MCLPWLRGRPGLAYPHAMKTSTMTATPTINVKQPIFAIRDREPGRPINSEDHFIGAPQFGQASALLLISFPHSLHSTSANSFAFHIPQNMILEIYPLDPSIWHETPARKAIAKRPHLFRTFSLANLCRIQPKTARNGTDTRMIAAKATGTPYLDQASSPTTRIKKKCSRIDGASMRAHIQLKDTFALQLLQRTDLAGPRNCFVQKENVGSSQLGQP